MLGYVYRMDRGELFPRNLMASFNFGWYVQLVTRLVKVCSADMHEQVTQLVNIPSEWNRHAVLEK